MCAKCKSKFRDSTEFWACGGKNCENKFHPRCLKVLISCANTKQCCKNLYRLKEKEMGQTLPGTQMAGLDVNGGAGTAAMVGVGSSDVDLSGLSQTNPCDLTLVPTITMGNEVTQAALPSGWDVLSDSATLDKMMLDMVAMRRNPQGSVIGCASGK